MGGYGLFSRKKAKRAAVLCYHGVTRRSPNELREVPNSFLHIPVHLFEAQIRFIEKFFNPITLDLLVDAMEGKSLLPDRSVLVTFDDGYKSVHQLAKPILEKYSIKPSVFVTAPGGSALEMMWPDRVFCYFQKLGQKDRDIYQTIEGMKELGNEQRKAALEEILQKTSVSLDSLPEECRIMSEEDVRDLSKSGFDIGSHSSTHPILSKMSADEQSEEIAQSKVRLEKITGKPVEAFAYPNGRVQDFNEDTVRILKEKGYRTAFTTVEGYSSPDSDPYRLRRFFVMGNLPTYEFCHRMTMSWPSKYRVV